MHSLKVYLQYLWSGKAVSFMVLSQSDPPIDTQKRHLSIYLSIIDKTFGYLLRGEIWLDNLASEN